MMRIQMRNYKNYILLSVIMLSQLHVIFRGSNMRVDWYLFIEHTRRIDYAVMYLCKHLIYVIYSYCLLFPKGINKDVKVFVFILSILDLLHYLLYSHLNTNIAIYKIFGCFALISGYYYVKKCLELPNKY